MYRNACDVRNISFLSEFCLTSSITNEPCEPDISDSLRRLAGIWCIINAIVGFSGNLLTLLAIPYASRHKRFSLHRNWNTTTIFILNLAAADFLYCAINLPLYAHQYLMRPGGNMNPTLCYMSTAFRYVNAFADWMSLGMIALSRCIALIWPSLSNRLSTGANGKIVIICIWLYANILLIPIYAENTFKMGTFGYNCRLGKCDFVPTNDAKTPQVLFYGIGFTLPCFLTTVSYICIWGYVRASSTYLRRFPDENRRQVNSRDLKMTWTILMVCLCYFIFVMPISVLNMADPHADNATVHLVAFCLYWMQYSLNFLVYAARSKQYRQAYVYFICRIKAWLGNLCCGLATTMTTTTSHIYFINRNMPQAAVYCHYQQDCHIQGLKPTSPIISMHSIGDGGNLSGGVRSADHSAVIIMTRSKTKKKKLWRRQTSSLTEKRDADGIGGSSSVNMTWLHDDDKEHMLCVVFGSPEKVGVEQESTVIDGNKSILRVPSQCRKKSRRRKSI